MPLAKAVFSSDRQDWNTPEEVLRLVRQIGPIGLDPCSNENSIVRAKTEWQLERDGDSLAKDWRGYGLTFINPPYSREIPKWVHKCALSPAVEIVLLVPSRTDTRWFKNICDFASALCFWSGRITFLGAESPAPFPSMLVYYGNRADLFVEIFKEKGLIVKL